MANNLFNLHIGEEDKTKVLENVKSNISFTGSNLWILVCAIMVASVGLNVNSTAVIIGAMLISPLMGPIVGAGFALGTFDFILLKKSLTNLFIATIASLIASSIYFGLSPFKEAQSELLARTSPNIYDVFIAFFGGLAGVIALTRVEKGNPIPGVAIATALMPPLCTAGYGLATGQISFFLGAMFLYSINCVFICLATFTIVKYLKYPVAKQLDIEQEKRIHFIIYGLVFCMVLPSVYFAYTLFQEQTFRKNANIFIEKEFTAKGNVIVFKNLNYSPTSQKIELAFLKKQYSVGEISQLQEKLTEYNLKNTKLQIRDGGENLNQFKDDILNEVDKKGQELIAIEKNTLESKFDTKQLFSEANALFPNIEGIMITKQDFAFKDSLKEKYVIIYQSQYPLNTKDTQLFQNWMKLKLKTENMLILNTK